MQRRQFLRNSILPSTTGLVGPAAVSQTVHAVEPLAAPVVRRCPVLSQTYRLNPPKGSNGVARLQIPLPIDTTFQQVTALAPSGNYEHAYVTTGDTYGAGMLFATQPDSQSELLISVNIDTETADRGPLKQGTLKTWQAPEQIIYPLDIRPYLLPTTHAPVDGQVLGTTRKTTGSEQNPLEEARLTYGWVGSHMERDNDVIGYGTEGVAEILRSGELEGKCIDMSFVFVALPRASGIPARKLFGIRLDRANKLERYSKNTFDKADSAGVADMSGGQHCRAEFYLAGCGWSPCDPADVTKVCLTKKKSHRDVDVRAVNAYLFGNQEMNWVEFNYERDFELYPATGQGAMNNFGYPYAEVDGNPINFYDPKAFSYSYVATEQR